jgi:hypothetical protein
VVGLYRLYEGVVPELCRAFRPDVMLAPLTWGVAQSDIGRAFDPKTTAET